jgi:hypothetical protein
MEVASGQNDNIVERIITGNLKNDRDQLQIIFFFIKGHIATF